MTAGQVDQVIEFTTLEAMQGFISAMSQMAKNFEKMKDSGIKPSLNFFIGTMPGVTVGMPGKVAVQATDAVRSAADAAAEFSAPNPPNQPPDNV